MKTMLNIKTEKSLKTKAQQIAKKMGVPLSLVINAYLRTFIRDRSVTFSLEPKLKPEVWKEVQQARKEYVQNKTYGPFSSVKDMVADLES